MKYKDIEIGNRLMVKSDCQTTGCAGKVVNKGRNNLITLLLEDIQTTRVYNCGSLRRIEDNTMDGNHKERDFYVVTVNHIATKPTTYNNHSISHKSYNFKCYDKTVTKGATVVCDNAGGYSLGNVTSIKEKFPDSIIPTKEVISIVDFKDFTDRKVKARRKQDIKIQLDTMMTELSREILYETLAEKNPKFASLLNELKGLGE